MADSTAKMRNSDGRLVRVHPDGREKVLVKRPIRPMPEAGIAAAAHANPYARLPAPGSWPHT